MSVYIVIANDCERVQECIAFTGLARAMNYFDYCKAIYGGANVAICARALDEVPDNLFRYALTANMDGKAEVTI